MKTRSFIVLQKRNSEKELTKSVISLQLQISRKQKPVPSRQDRIMDMQIVIAREAGYITARTLRIYNVQHSSSASDMDTTVEPPLTDTSHRQTPFLSGHLAMYPATYIHVYKHYIFNLP